MKPPNFAIILGLLGLFLSAPCAGDEDASLALLSPTEATAAGAGSYDLESNFCWLLAHSAARVGNSIIFDGGMAKYKVTVNGIDYGVPDLNGYTMSLDLSKDFRLDDLNSRLTILAKKAGADAQWKDGYSVNRGGMWTDGKDVWLQGGHFYTFVRYDNSTWHVDKAQIPAYEIWKYSQGKGWQKEKFTVEFGRDIRRTVSGASACTSETCYWFGCVDTTFHLSTVWKTNSLLFRLGDISALAPRRKVRLREASVGPREGCWHSSWAIRPCGTKPSMATEQRMKGLRMGPCTICLARIRRGKAFLFL